MALTPELMTVNAESVTTTEWQLDKRECNGYIFELKPYTPSVEDNLALLNSRNREYILRY